MGEERCPVEVLREPLGEADRYEGWLAFFEAYESALVWLKAKPQSHSSFEWTNSWPSGSVVVGDGLGGFFSEQKMVVDIDFADRSTRRSEIAPISAVADSEPSDGLEPPSVRLRRTSVRLRRLR